MAKLHLYLISADGGKTFTRQWMTNVEAREHRNLGYIVK